MYNKVDMTKKVYKADSIEDDNLEETPAIIRKNTARKIVENDWIDETTVEAVSEEETVAALKDFVDEHYKILSARTYEERPTELLISINRSNWFSVEIDTDYVEFSFE